MILLGYSKNKMKVNVTNSLITKSINIGILSQEQQKTKTQNVNFQNTTVSYNQNGGLRILTKDDCEYSEVSIYNCTISNNNLKSTANPELLVLSSHQLASHFGLCKKRHKLI